MRRRRACASGRSGSPEDTLLYQILLARVRPGGRGRAQASAASAWTWTKTRGARRALPNASWSRWARCTPSASAREERSRCCLLRPGRSFCIDRSTRRTREEIDSEDTVAWTFQLSHSRQQDHRDRSLRGDRPALPGRARGHRDRVPRPPRPQTRSRPSRASPPSWTTRACTRSQTCPSWGYNTAHDDEQGRKARPQHRLCHPDGPARAWRTWATSAASRTTTCSARCRRWTCSCCPLAATTPSTASRPPSSSSSSSPARPIPMHYKTPGLTVAVSGAEDFLSRMGEGVERVSGSEIEITAHDAQGRRVRKAHGPGIKNTDCRKRTAFAVLFCWEKSKKASR